MNRNSVLAYMVLHTVIVIVILAVFAQPRLGSASSAADGGEINAERINIVDSTGVVKLSLYSSKENLPCVEFYGEEGQAVMSLSLEQLGGDPCGRIELANTGSAIILKENKIEKVRLWLGDHGAALFISHDDRTPAVMIGEMDGVASCMLENKLHNARVDLTCSDQMARVGAQHGFPMKMNVSMAAADIFASMNVSNGVLDTETMRLELQLEEQPRIIVRNGEDTQYLP